MPPPLGDLLTVALTWWAVSLSGVLMPGPVSAMAVSEGARRGALAGPLITAGHAVAELLMVAALAAGLSQVLRLPSVVGAIGVLGGFILLWMGWGILRTARAGPVSEWSPASRTPAGTPHGLAWTGLLTTISNPYWLLWWATVGGTYLVAFSRFGIAAIAVVFLAGHLALDLGWTTFLALAVGAGKRRVPARAYQAVLGVCGIFVMAMSAYFVYSGLGFLTRR